MNHINYQKQLAVCEICDEAIYEGQGNIMMMGFNGVHAVHVIHVQDNCELYLMWRNNLLKKTV
jgi:hypothetical protein